MIVAIHAPKRVAVTRHGSPIRLRPATRSEQQIHLLIAHRGRSHQAGSIAALPEIIESKLTEF